MERRYTRTLRVHAEYVHTYIWSSSLSRTERILSDCRIFINFSYSDYSKMFFFFTYRHKFVDVGQKEEENFPHNVSIFVCSLETTSPSTTKLWSNKPFFLFLSFSSPLWKVFHAGKRESALTAVVTTTTIARWAAGKGENERSATYAINCSAPRREGRKSYKEMLISTHKQTFLHKALIPRTDLMLLLRTNFATI